MADNLTKIQRRKNMQNIRSKGTSIEKIVRSGLRKAGLKYRGNVKSILGNPDIVFKDARVVVFLDSCFWHSCPHHKTIPKSNKAYWIPKLERNKKRDIEVTKLLRKSGWKVIRIWEHRIRKHPENCLTIITDCVQSRINLSHQQ